MRYLSIDEVIALHRENIEAIGGSFGIRDKGAIESALAQPQVTFDGEELNPSLAMKAAALGFFLSNNHAFIDGNKRTAHAAMESFLILNGYTIFADVAEQEAIFLRLATGEMTKDELGEWLEDHIIEID